MVKFKGISVLFFSLALGLLSLSPSYANNLASVASAPVASTNLPETAQPSDNQGASIQNTSPSPAGIIPATSSDSSSADQTSGNIAPLPDPSEANGTDSSSANQASGNIAPIPDSADNASSSNQDSTNKSSATNTTSATKQNDTVTRASATTPSLASNSTVSGVQAAGIESVIASPETTITNRETQANLLRTPSSAVSGENQSAVIYKTENKRYVKAKNLADMLPNSDIYHINWNPAMLLVAGLALSSWLVAMFVISYRQNKLEAQI